MNPMNRHDVQWLQGITGYPAGTITAPTHRSAPEHRHNPIRVKNLVQGASDPWLKDGLAGQRRETQCERAKAVNQRRFVSPVGEVWRLTSEGPGRLMLAEEDFHHPARVDETSRHIVPAVDAIAPDVIDDGADEIIETALDRGGHVVFVHNGQLAADQRIALILRG